MEVESVSDLTRCISRIVTGIRFNSAEAQATHVAEAVRERNAVTGKFRPYVVNLTRYSNH
jgi:hypothetical protein